MSLLLAPAPILERLPIDVRGGVHLNLLAPNSATFVFYAPFKPFVSLVGDFNDWDTRTNPMQTDGNGLWWTTIPQPGPARYGFYVALDEQSHCWVGDPYATRVDWQGAVPWGVTPCTTTFAWQDQAWRTPALRDLVIYELCVRDFAGYWQANEPYYGNFEELIHYIPYLVELGINAVELMPIHAFPGESSWGYNPVFYFAVANTYGSPEMVKRFINECHRQGIAVILDVAFNHTSGEHPYYQIYPPLYSAQGERLTDWNPFFHHTPSAINMWGGVDWDHFAPETTRYFQDVVRFWLQEYHLDGFRFDWVGGVEYDSNNPLQPGFNPYHGISAIAWAARQAKPDCVLIGEFWSLEGTNPEKTGAKLVAETELDAVWHGDFHHILDDVLNQRWQWEQRDLLRALAGFREVGFTAADQTVVYSCSHDEVRPEHEIKYYTWPHIQRPAGMNVAALALAKGLLGLVAVFVSPGVPMIYAGQEFGEDAPRTIDFQPIHWGRLLQAAHATHRQVVARLIAARRAHPALRSDHLEFYADDFVHEHLVRCKRWSANGLDYVTAALNFGHHERVTELEIPWGGRWYDVIHDREYLLQAGKLTINLAPWDTILLIHR